MRKLLLAILLLPFFAQSQTIYDTATIRSRVNAQIVPNGTQAITGQMLNDILNGYLNAWPDTRIFANYPLSWNAHTHTMSFTGTLTGVPTSRSITINGITQDLSANRTWSVGTVTNVGSGWGLLGGPITNVGSLSADTSLISSKWYTTSVYNAIRSRFSALSPIVYDPSTGQFSLTTVPVSKGGTGLTAVGTNGQVLRSNGTGLYYFTPNWLTGNDTISLSNRINRLNFTVEDPLYFTGSVLHLDYFKNTYNARWINGIQVRPIAPNDNQVLQYKAWTGMAQWMDLDSLVAAASNDYDTLALSKVITLNAGTGITIPETAGQTLGLPPDWTVNTDTTLISTKWYVDNKFDSIAVTNNNANIGSGYRWLKPGTQEIKTAFGDMLLIDSTTNANGLTLKVDTSVIASKSWVTTNTTSGISNNANVGSSYRWLKPGSQEIKTFHAGYGEIIDSTSFANELDLTVDTSAAGLATYNYVTNTFNTYNLAKQAKLTLTTTGTSGVSTLDGSGNLNIPNYGGGTSSGTVTSVGISMPSAFSVANSPVTTAGTFSVTGAGTSTQTIAGNGTLVNNKGLSSLSYGSNTLTATLVSGETITTTITSSSSGRTAYSSNDTMSNVTANGWDTAFYYTIPANALKANSLVEIMTNVTGAFNANSKNVAVYYGQTFPLAGVEVWTNTNSGASIFLHGYAFYGTHNSFTWNSREMVGFTFPNITGPSMFGSIDYTLPTYVRVAIKSVAANDLKFWNASVEY